ncbi:MAG: guanylate kinase [Candidatus Nanopelagicaceae bacterium]
MATPPKLTADQRIAALEAAKVARRTRAAIKDQVKSGELKLLQVLELAATNPAIGKMRVSELIEAIPGVGKVRAATLLNKLGISATRRIQGLGVLQLQSLKREFRNVNPAIRPGKLFVLSGPGGVGKSTITKALSGHKDFWVSVSATTRSPRNGELDGVDYYYISSAEFERRIEDSEFLEWAEFAGAKYGTPASAVNEKLASGFNVVLEIEIDGARQVRKSMPTAQLIFIAPPSWEELKSRLQSRGTDSDERRAQRLALAQEEMAAQSEFDYVLVNDRLERVVAELVSLAADKERR